MLTASLRDSGAPGSRAVLLSGLACLLGVSAFACVAAGGVGAGPKIEPIAMPMQDGFTFAAVGDLIYLRPILPTLRRTAPELLKILSSADLTFGNLETSVLDLPSTRAVPQAESGGTWMLADPRVPADLKAMGFDLVSRANNHATDWGVAGMLETGHRLDDVDLVHAGVGKSLSAARASRYVDLPSGRAGLVAATSTFTPMSRAADPLGEAPARPGVNAIRTDRMTLVSKDTLAVLARAAREPAHGGVVRIGGEAFEAAANVTRPVVTFTANPADAAANLLAIRQAHQNGNFVIFSLHAHQPGNESQVPAEFAERLARAAVDSGADAVVSHGPHQVRGIEIYKGRPIFYSLGNFAMMNNSLDVVPSDMYERFGADPVETTAPELLQARNEQTFAAREMYESVLALSRYEHGAVVEIRLYPIDLGVRSSGADRGVPRDADPDVAGVVLERLQRLSARYGTRIIIERGIGVWCAN